MTPARPFGVLVALLVIGAPSAVGAQPSDHEPADDVGAVPPARVLFVGNSHTARNGGLDWEVGNLVRAAHPGREFRGWKVTASGADLEDHYRNGVTARLRLGGYDVAVLQGHLPVSFDGDADSFLRYGRLFHRIVSATGARTVFFMTWPQARFEHVDLDDIVAAHRRLADELHVDVAPGGIAMDMARTERPDLELIGPDGIHATWAGAYLAAAVVYATIFDESPVGLPYTFGVSDEEAAFLQRIAWQAVADWRSGEPPRTATTE